jgi:hypothetical protein
MKRLIPLFALAACGGAQQRTEDLLEAVRTYHEAIRWERLAMAASRVPVKERDAFFEEREDLVPELHISDYELVRVAKAEHGGSKVEVKWTWYKESEGVVHETRSMETWERQGKQWMIVGEERMRGPEMPGLREGAAPPAAEADPDDQATNP